MNINISNIESIISITTTESTNIDNAPSTNIANNKSTIISNTESTNVNNTASTNDNNTEYTNINNTELTILETKYNNDNDVSNIFLDFSEKNILKKLILTCKINKDNFLFNYKQNIKSMCVELNIDTLIIRDDNNIDFFDLENYMNFFNSTHIPLFKIIKHDNTFLIQNVEKSLMNKYINYILSPINKFDNGYYICKENEIFMIGKTKFLIKQLVLSDHENKKLINFLEMNNINNNINNICYNTISLLDTQCRVCFHDDNTLDNPLITPCLCKGSIEHIHLNCLRHEILSKPIFKEFKKYKKIYFYPKNKLIYCNICKSSYKTCIINNEKQSIICITNYNIKPPYIIIEANNGFHIISLFYDNVIKIGRHKFSDIYIEDSSVSRDHATLSFINNQFILQDNNSKFGTHIVLNNFLNLEIYNKLSILVAGTYFEFNLL